MKSVLALATVCLMSSSAFAGVFVGVGVGTGTNYGDSHIAEDGRSTRLEGGYMLPLGAGRIGGEVLYQGYDVNATYPSNPTVTMNAKTFGIAARYNLPLSNGFEIFGRLGWQKTTLDSDTRSVLNMDGSGKLLGIGAELHPNFKIGVDLGFFVDLTMASATLDSHNGNGNIGVNGDATFATLGVSVGF